MGPKAPPYTSRGATTHSSLPSGCHPRESLPTSVAQAGRAEIYATECGTGTRRIEIAVPRVAPITWWVADTPAHAVGSEHSSRIIDLWEMG